jgi:hypothetical protein
MTNRKDYELLVQQIVWLRGVAVDGCGVLVGGCESGMAAEHSG